MSIDSATQDPVTARVDALDWDALSGRLDESGFAVTPALLDGATCGALAAAYGDDGRFRSRVVMARHNFGLGEYRYFDYPLPGVVDALRRSLYRRLAPVASRWAGRLGEERTFPPSLADYLDECRAAGQRRPTPLLLRYGAGDYNCLHQDVYGEEVFPLQAAVLLSEPGRDFEGGEFVLVEQRPRMQSRAHVVALGRGEAVVFAVRHRPRRGKRGDHRVQVRHGVSTVARGERLTLGVIFHDAA